MTTFRDHVRRAVKIAGTEHKLAAAIGISQPSVNHLCRHAKSIRAEVALAIEKATDGQVHRADLRPDLWSREAAA